MTTPMLLMFALGVTAALPAGWALARVQMARHSALLNESVRAASVRFYGREWLATLGRRDRAASRAVYAEEGSR